MAGPAAPDPFGPPRRSLDPRSLAVPALCVLLGLAAAASSRWLLAAAGAVVGLLVARRLLRPDLTRLRLCLRSDARARSGQPLAAQLHVHHEGSRPVGPLRLRLLVAGAGAPVDVAVPALRPGDVARVDLRVTAGRRGVHPGSVTRVTGSDPLGLGSAVLLRSRPGEVVVRPAPAAPGRPLLARRPLDRAPRPSVHGTDEVAGLRPWRPGEDQRHVHWRASARRGRLVVVERDEPDDARQWVLVLAGTPAGEADERLLARAAATCLATTAADHPVTVLAWAADGVRLAPPGASPEELLDWFGRLGPLATPGAGQLLQARPEGCEALTLLGLGAAAASSWADEVGSRLADAGVRVQRGLDEVPR